MKIPIESSKKKFEYSIHMYGALDVRLFPNKCLNVDLKNIEIWVSHCLNSIVLLAHTSPALRRVRWVARREYAALNSVDS